MNPQPISCFVIGSDPTLCEYLQLIVDKGHQLKGVVTRNDRVRDWARSKGISAFEVDTCRESLAKQDFDYLFAITHLEIIPDDVLKLPRKAAINVHGSLLPRYAGLNSPAWALMHREETYGVTWHFMISGVDRGDIVKQRSFPVAANETSLSLNTRCFEAAVDSLSELLDELASGTITAQPQDQAQFTYFGRHARPAAACMLDWRRPAEELEALVRALDFGANENLLGSPKVGRGGHQLIVRRAEVRPDVTGDPGTIVEIDDEAIVVAAGRDGLAILTVGDSDGTGLDLAEASARLQLGVGTLLDVFDDCRAEQLTELNRQLCRHERAWVTSLERLDPVVLPVEEGAGAEVGNTISSTVTIPPALLPAGVDASSVALAAFALYLARTADKSDLDVGFSDAETITAHADVASLVADTVPFHVEVDFTQPWPAMVAQVGETASRLRRQRTWLRDAMGRFPQLRHRAAQIHRGLNEVVFDTRPGAERGSDTLLRAVLEPGATLKLLADADRISNESLEQFAHGISTLLQDIAARPDVPVGDADLLGESIRTRVLERWNETEVAVPPQACIHSLFVEQARRTPDAIALIFEGAELTYRELDRRSNQLASYLRSKGVGPGVLVGVHVDRSLDLMVATYGILKAGGAYLPLDPAYPRDRLAFLIEDAAVRLIIGHSDLRAALPPHQAEVIEIDQWEAIATHSDAPLESQATSSDLAYVIYTSGSTGKPKGVQIEHRNVVNFFLGMDDRIAHDPPGVWLAVTSLSFDISVLELFWTLARGFKVVLYRDHERGARQSPSPGAPMDFSLFYFAAGESTDQEKYRLLLEGARFADTHGFSAVWTPERHFHAFGGLYPNPAITGAAIATITKNVQIRAGSVVVPLHHPVRIAEAWSMVDNLSGGRAAISIASGWQPNDFVLAPDNYKDAKQLMFDNLETVRQLWRGEAVRLPGPMGDEVECRTYPRPVQAELPIWVTTAGNIETYRRAGSIGGNILTHLLGQTIDDLKDKIAAYREARAAAGHDPSTGIVSLMLHTFVGEDEARVKDLVREPLKAYLSTSMGLLKQHAHTFFAAFTRPGARQADGDILASLSDEERETMLEHAFERYFQTSGLFGTVDRAAVTVRKLHQVGIDEVACLVDFGVDTDAVLSSLHHLDELRRRFVAAPHMAQTDRGGISLPQQILEYNVTHLQCTPSMARMLTMMEGGEQALQSLQHIMIGGEAFPIPLAHDLDRLAPAATITNMYGPTETTIWSSTHPVSGKPDNIPIGRPIANTSLYVLDSRRQPVPPGTPGELYIGGLGVARGYLNRPDLTAERFVADPFASNSARMYRTGDVARWRPDGVMEFLGRVDHQIKVHGHRIEPGEIEVALAQHPEVRESVVVSYENAPGDHRLVAYVVGEGIPPTASALRQLLSESLPDYMVPSHFVMLDRLPLTPNGKVDRKALPAPDAQPTRSEASYAAPENDLDRIVVEVWQETLGLDSVGIDDNFFDIGGHSLLVVSMHRRLREMLEQTVTLTDLYRFPTIRALTSYLSGADQSDALAESTQRAQQRRAAMGRRDRRRRSQSN